MGIMKPHAMDAYAYLIGTFPIASTAISDVKQGMMCKLNTKGEIVLAGKGEKGFVVQYPNQLPKRGMAIKNASFIHGPFCLTVDNECFDDTQTYVIGELLYVGDNGKLTNQKEANAIPVARAMSLKKTINEELKTLKIASVDKACCPTA